MGVCRGNKKQSTLKNNYKQGGRRQEFTANYPSLAKNSTKENQSRKAFKSASSSLVLQLEATELPFLRSSVKNNPKNKKSNRHSKATVALEAGAINIRSSRQQHC